MSSNITTREYKDESAGDAFTALLLSLLAIVPLALWGGFVLKTVWNWFIPEIFASAPHLNMAQAIGLSLVVSWFTARRQTSYSESEGSLEGFFKDLLFVLFYGCIVLLMGLIVHSFM